MATLSTGGRITDEIVDNEIQRLQADWNGSNKVDSNGDDNLLQKNLDAKDYENIDVFEQTQLAQVIRICKESKSMADAGRKLFNKSRLQKSASNDSQRLRSYLKKYNVEFKELSK